MFLKVFTFLILLYIPVESSQLDAGEFGCTGIPHANVTMTAYYPDYTSDDESDYTDIKGKKLRTLQDYIDGRSEYVTVAMDRIPELPYGSVICVPELNKHYRRAIPLQVRDEGLNMRDAGFSRLDICVRSEVDSYDKAVNKMVTVYSDI